MSSGAKIIGCAVPIRSPQSGLRSSLHEFELKKQECVEFSVFVSAGGEGGGSSSKSNGTRWGRGPGMGELSILFCVCPKGVVATG